MNKEITEIIKQIVRENEASTEGVFDDKHHYILKKNDDHSIVEFDGKQYKVTGTERLKVSVLKQSKPKKEKLPDRITKKCKCGAEFQVSKFNHYFEECKECRKGKASKVEVICETCGATFESSKFTPYVNKCPDCRKIDAESKKTAKKEKVVEK